MKRMVTAVLAISMLAACGSSADDSTADDSTTENPTTTASAPVTTSVPAATPVPTDPPISTPAGLVSNGERAAIDPDAPVAELVSGFNDAGFELLRGLPDTDNVVFSPASIGHALLMAEAAGDEPTRQGVATLFDLPDGAHDAWNTIDRAIAASQSDRVTVTIADRIWPRLDVAPDQQWVDLLASRHGADVVPLDFARQNEASRQIMNDWVGEQTDGLIPELFPAGSIESDTVLALTDAIYFAADWALPFGKYGAQTGSFTGLDGTRSNTSFMRELELDDRRGFGDGFAGAEIPYAGDDYSMLVLVPDEGRYEGFIDRLDQALLDDIDATFMTGPYELLLPKWSDSFQFDLLGWLTDNGVAPGSFPAIAPGAFLGAAVHAADIAVDEMGTVAAAATGLAFAESGPPEPEFTIAANRPFVYLIRHRSTGLVLFLGHVTDPS